ncbi:hypothetical protein B0I21_101532 [Sphingobacterium paludis]|uniref:Uncharacterized protein n=1 Tax=Sphingobacterium paludis TaxID=1476465 RepID=A0A4R7DBK4_9SPHI|nr:hypothetical protein B0I21_101532 [Sphingobacterium paludis]
MTNAGTTALTNTMPNYLISNFVHYIVDIRLSRRIHFVRLGIEYISVHTHLFSITLFLP